MPRLLRNVLLTACILAASLGSADPAKANDVYHSLVDPLVDKPLETRDPRGLSYSDAIVGTILPLYSPDLWRHLTQALNETLPAGALTFGA